MSQIVVLKNEFLTVQISTLGAEMLSVKDAQGVEYLWEGDPAFWEGHAPVLFPLCGGLKDGAYLLNGRRYELEKHGFARHEEFSLLRAGKTEAVFLLRENERTFPGFPFPFVFMVAFVLDRDRVRVTYTVHNTGTETMYFNVGAHEAYATPGGIENYEVYFDRSEELAPLPVHGNLLGRETGAPLVTGHVLPLKKELFMPDALVFGELNSRAVTLARKGGGRTIRVAFDGFDHLLLWQVPGAPYLCIEPWCGLPDFEDADGNIAHKQSITELPAGDTYARTHIIGFSHQ